MKRFLHVSVFFVVTSAGVVVLAPDAAADAYDDVCRMRAAGHDDMSIVQTIQDENPNSDLFAVEQFVVAAESARCPLYLGAPSYAGPPVLPGPGA
jgi:hypothetical protein